MTLQEMKNLSPKEQKILYKRLNKLRGKAKQVNFSCIYGAGGPKIAETLKISLKEGMNLHKAYWAINKGVKQTAKSCTVKKFNGQTWLYNPVAGFWYFLKEDKDRFSTLNQGTGSYVFDLWLKKCREKLAPLGIKVCMQYHDELLIWYFKIYREQVNNILKQSMIEVNEELQLNVSISISIDEGKNYADCH